MKTATAFIHNHEGQNVVTVTAIVGRIRRRLANLVPYRELEWNARASDYYISAKGGPPLGPYLGPYHFQYLVALAEHVNAFKLEERSLVSSLSIITSTFRIVRQEPLPVALRFPVLTKALHVMKQQLEQHGFTVTAPVMSDKELDTALKPWEGATGGNKEE